MTKQVRTGYRKHRKATWVFALLLALTVGAVLVPFASGAGGKTYTFTGNFGACSGTTSVSFNVVLKNTSANSQNLGSADLYAPSDITVTNATMSGSSTGSIAFTTYPNAVPPDTNDPTTTGRSLISLLSLTVPGGASVTISVTASLSNAPGTGTYWYSIVKQANSFNPGSLDTSNTLTIQGSTPTVTAGPCQYYFSQQPTNASTNAAQTVKVQLRSGSTPVAVSGSLTLSANQNGSPVGSFTGLTSSGQDATNTWVFNSVTGTQSGDGYQLVAGGGTAQEADSNAFSIIDCNPGPGNTCTSPQILNGDGTGGGQITGNGVLSGIDLSFAGQLPDSAKTICQDNWGWQDMTFPAQPNGRTTFDGITTSSTSYQSGTGYLLVTLYLRNDLYVQTTASQTNNIQICAGAVHTVLTNDGTNPWMGANSTPAQFDTSSDAGGGMYWGVLQRISNCNANKIPVNNGIKSPALCAWGTVTIGGVSYRSATVVVPYDWDFQAKG